MRTFENLLIKFTDLLCRLLCVTPGQLEYIRQKKKGPTPHERASQCHGDVARLFYPSS